MCPAYIIMQHIGMPFIVMHIIMPGIIMAVMQSQQACIILTAFMSPLVQVIMQPMSVISHLQVAIIMLQQQTICPFIIMQQPHMPPCIIMHIC
jgi:hypothetical protein